MIGDGEMEGRRLTEQPICGEGERAAHLMAGEGEGAANLKVYSFVLLGQEKAGGEGEEGFKASIKSKTSFLVVGILDILEQRLRMRTWL